jgi:hypothetical protein
MPQKNTFERLGCVLRTLIKIVCAPGFGRRSIPPPSGKTILFGLASTREMACGTQATEVQSCFLQVLGPWIWLGMVTAKAPSELLFTLEI